MKLHNNSKEIMPTIKSLSIASLLAMTLLPITSYAEYIVNIPLDSTAFAKSGDTGVPTNPTEPTTPTEPVEDKTITLTSNHQTLKDNTGNYIVSLYKSAGDAQPFASQLKWPLNSQFDNFSVVVPDDDTYNNAKKLNINGVDCVIETRTPANRSVGCNATVVTKTSVGSTIVIKIIK